MSPQRMRLRKLNQHRRAYVLWWHRVMSTAALAAVFYFAFIYK